MADLSRDTRNAHHGVEVNGDVQKVSDNLAVQAEGMALATSALDAYGKYAQRQAEEANAALEARLTAEGKLNDRTTAAGREATLKAQPEYRSTDYGPGSDYWTRGSAAAGLLAGALGGNLKAGAAAGAAPLLASLVKEQENPAARAALHGIVAAALTQLAGGSGTEGLKAGAAGAVTASVLTEHLVSALYGKDSAVLTADERRLVSSLVTLAGAGMGYAAGGEVSLAATGAVAAKAEVENNSLAVDRAREAAKQATETLKNQVRDRLGEGTTSAIANAIINGLADTGDAALGSVDYIADVAMALAAYAAGDSYYSKAMSDLAGKNQAVADTVTALMQSETWSAVADQVKQAAGGNQAALEATGGLLAGIILPGKKVPHTPNAGAVGNMSEFFKQSGFGGEVKELSKKTSKQYQGQSVYKADKSIGDYIKKGDQFYLDAKHKDHIEVFDSTGTKVKAVLNLDGSFNDAKTKAARAEGRRLPK